LLFSSIDSSREFDVYNIDVCVCGGYYVVNDIQISCIKETAFCEKVDT